MSSSPMATRANLRASSLLLLLFSFFTLTETQAARLRVGTITTISNQAEVSFEGGSTGFKTALSNLHTFDVTYLPESTAATIQFYRLDPTSSIETIWRPYLARQNDGSLREFDESSSLSPASSVEVNPQADLSGAIASDTAQGYLARISPVRALTFGEPVLVIVTDFDNNLARRAIDEIELQLVSEDDAESIILRETQRNSGVFATLIRPQIQSRTPYNGRIELGETRTMRFSYRDAYDDTDAGSASLALGQVNRLFNAATGEPVDNIRLTLLNATTNQPAPALGPDGLPTGETAEVITGRTPPALAELGIVLKPGEFAFPRAPPGQYRVQLSLAPTDEYTFPSSVPDEHIANLPGDFLLTDGSRGETFDLDSNPPVFDIPLDTAGNLFTLTLTSSRDRVAVGDMVEFTATATNRSVLKTFSDTLLELKLPRGFRLVPKTLKVDDARSAFTVEENAESLRLNLGEMTPTVSREIRFLANVTHSPQGKAEATAFARSRTLSSNQASVSLRVDDALMSAKAFVLGRVVICENGQPTAEGLGGVRVRLETGALGTTDARGQFHFEGLEPGAHLVQLDRLSLPSGYEVISVGEQLDDKPHSRLIDLGRGALWRVEFFVQRTHAEPHPASPSAPVSAPAVAAEDEPFFKPDKKWLDAQPDDNAWLLPAAGALPHLPSTQIAVKHRTAHKLTALLNGTEVPAVNFHGQMKRSDGAFALSLWSGVNLREGDNEIEIIRKDSFGNERGREKRVIHFSSAPVTARLQTNRSRLVADGSIKPLIAVRFLDKDGQPARKGVTLRYRLNAPYELFNHDLKNMRDRPGIVVPSPEVTIGDDGVGLIELEPTVLSGDARLFFSLASGEREVIAPLFAGTEGWTLVGIADGTLAHRTLSGNMEALPENERDTGFAESGRVAVFAKGKIKGSWLLTAAYDSAKKRAPRDTLGDAIDPEAYYTLYGDQSTTSPEARSRDKLYLKLERKAFSALFGSFDLDWTACKFAGAQTSMQGVKIDYRGERLRASAFQSETGFRYGRQEFPAHGTLGDYQLTRTDLIPNSEKISVEERDRTRSSIVVSQRPLTRNVDYTIDYKSGRIRLNRPLFTVSAELNPQFLIVQFEVDDQTGARASGARAEYQLLKPLTVGATALNRTDDLASKTVISVDARLQLAEKIQATAELAQSGGSGSTPNASAYNISLARQTEKNSLRAYANSVERGFGLGELSESQLGQRQIGVEGLQRLGQRLLLQANAYQDDDLSTGAFNRVAEAELVYQHESYGLSLGARATEEKKENGETLQQIQSLTGVEKSFFAKRLQFKVDREQHLSGDETSAEFPTRTTFRARYEVSPKLEFQAIHEIEEFARPVDPAQPAAGFSDDQTQRTRVGFNAKPWKGAETLQAVSSGQSSSGGTGATPTLESGFSQKWQLGPRLEIESGFESTTPMQSTASTATADTERAVSVFSEFHLNTKDKSYDARLENYFGASTERLALAASVTSQESEDLGLLGGLFGHHRTGENGAESMDIDARFGVAWRPAQGPLWILNRLDFKTTRLDSIEQRERDWRIVENLHANLQLSSAAQLSLHLGAKYSNAKYDSDWIDDLGYFASVEARYKFARVWDAGIHASTLGTIYSRTRDFGYGVSVGRRFRQELWVSIGYNFDGVHDEDFAQGHYLRRGPVLRFRFAFDEDTIKGLLKSAKTR